MNKVHRSIWSQALNRCVVAHEYARTRGKPSSTRKAVAAAVIAALGMTASLTALADSCPGASTSISAATTDACILDTDDDSVTVTSTGAITTSVSPAVTASADNVDITNQSDGLISATNNYSAIYYDVDLNGSLSNSGEILSNGDDDATSIYVNRDLSGLLTNTLAGKISAVADAGAGYGGSASATGIRVVGDLSGNLTNAGEIGAEAIAYGGSTASARGIFVGDDLSGTLDNSGTISAMASNPDSYYATATGVRVGGNLSSTGILDNSGLIEATAVNQNSSSATAYGVRVSGNLIGTLDNSGTISAVATDAAESASAYGVYVSGTISETGLLVNDGAITAVAEAGTNNDDATAVGIYINGTLRGDIENNGTIGATATAYNYGGAEATGIYVNGDIQAGATLDNSGTINVDMTNVWGSQNARGIYIDGDVNGTLTSKDINVNVTTEGNESTVYGIRITGDVTGTVTNTGTLDLNHHVGSDSSSSASGVRISGTLSGTFDNRGTIDVSMDGAEGGDGIEAEGVHVGYIEYGGRFLNSGLIDVSATAIATEATAIGVHMLNLYGGSLSNSGTINATAISYGGFFGYGGRAEATGISVDNLNGYGSSIHNTGTITARAEAEDGATAYGIQADSMGYGGIAYGGTTSARITNDKEINATAISTDAGANAYGISVGNLFADSSISNTSTGTITVEATADDTAYAYGINAGTVGSDGAASIVNGGSIDVSANSTNDPAYAYGIKIDILGDNSEIENNGTITASAEAYGGGAYAHGILTSATGLRAGATIINEGMITASAEGAEGYGGAFAWGIDAGNIAAGASVENYGGTITVSAEGSSGSGASAYGISVDTVASDGAVSNTGTISVSASAYGGTAFAAGIHADSLGLGATLTNNGLIMASVFRDSIQVDADGYSLDVDGGEGAVFNTGTLIGNINLGGTVSLTNSGTLYIPAGADGYVGGNYIDDGGLFSIGVDGSEGSDYASLQVGGTATLAANSRIDVDLDLAPEEVLVNGSTLDNVIFATTLVSDGTFNVTDNSLRYNFTGLKDGNTVDLSVTDIEISSVSEAVAATGTGSGAGLAPILDDLLADALADGEDHVDDEEDDVPEGMDNLVDALNALGSAEEVTNAVQQLLPLMTGGMDLATFGALSDSSAVVQARLESNEGLSSGDADSSRMMWAKPYGSWTDQDNRSGAAGYDANTYGIVIGADGEVLAGTRVGVAVAYAKSDVDSKVVSQTADIKTTQFMLYGSHSLDDTTDVNFNAGVGMHDNTGRRTITIVPAVAHSDYDSNSTQLGIGLGRVYELDGQSNITPSLRLDYVQLDDDAYTETGAGVYNLNVGDRSTEKTVVSLNGKYTRSLSEATRLTAKLGVGYDMSDEDTRITSSFVGGGPAFTTTGVDPSATSVSAGIGLVTNTQGGLQVSIGYDVEGASDYLNQSAAIKLRMPF